MVARIPGFIWSIDTDLRVTSIFGLGLADLGVQPGDIVGKTLPEHYQNNDVGPTVIAAHRRALQGESVDDHVCAAGRTYRSHVEPLTDESGAIVGCIGFAQDVTEQAAAELALRESEQRARGLLETLPLGAAECDADGVILLANPAYQRMLECSADESLGKRIVDLIEDGPQKEAFPEYWRRLVLEQPAPTPYVCRIVTKTGRHIDLHVDWTYKRDERGRLTGFVGILSDITEKLRAEREIRESRATLQATIDCLPFDFFALGLDGRYMIQNAASKAHWGNLVGNRPEDVAGNEENLAIWLDNNRRAFAGEKVEGEVELCVRGEERSIYNVLCPIQDEQRVYGILGMNMDITERKRAEALLKNAHDELERRVEQRTAELTKAVEQLKREVTERRQAEQALDRERRTLEHMLQASDHERQLIAYEIHDGLAQQLAGALMQLDTHVHLKDTKPHEAANAHDAAMTMLRQAHFEARRLISGVRPPILDESGIVAAIAHLVNEERRKKGPTIEFRSSVKFERLAPVMENAIYRIVQGGLANACTHSKSERVQISLLQRGGQVRIEIRDWGIGFQPEEAVDNRFGLEGIRERARLLGGKCEIHSEPGKGTRITIELPVGDPQ
jgi:PAS domain S-box-containing protein